MNAKFTPGKWETGSVMTSEQVLPKGWNMPMCIADCHSKHAPDSESERVANLEGMLEWARRAKLKQPNPGLEVRNAHVALNPPKETT